MPLTKTEAEEVASLFNSITVCARMMEHTPKRTLRWFLNAERMCSATVTLSDEYGIELPSVEDCRKDAVRYGKSADVIIAREGLNPRVDNLINADLQA